MNTDCRQARRYHWLSEGLRSFVDEPHAAIAGPVQGQIANLTDRRAALSRSCQVELVQDDPDRVVATLRRLARRAGGQRRHMYLRQRPPTCACPLGTTCARLMCCCGACVAHSRQRRTRAEGLRRSAPGPGVGARTVEALAMVSEVIHGAPYRFSDPAAFHSPTVARMAILFQCRSGVRRDNSRAAARCRAREARPRRQAVRDPAAGRTGTRARAEREGPTFALFIERERVRSGRPGGGAGASA